MMIDTSALVAIILDEEGSARLAELIVAAEAPFTTPAVVLEAALVLATRTTRSVVEAGEDVITVLDRFGVASKPVDDAVLTHALDAAQRFGKGRGHPAQLNLVDCLSYGAARAAGVGLLYKGDDFARTDLPPLPTGPA